MCRFVVVFGCFYLFCLCFFVELVVICYGFVRVMFAVLLVYDLVC